MAAIQFPTYTYLAGASPLAPKGNGNPMAEQMLRRAVLLGYTIAEHLELKPAYTDDHMTPNSDDALRLDAVLNRGLGASDATMLQVARRSVMTAIKMGGWDEYMRAQVANPGARTYRSATAAPDLMALAMASKIAANLKITPPRFDTVEHEANDPGLPLPADVRAPHRAVPAKKAEPAQGAFDFGVAA